jgi:phage-related protein
MSLIMAKEKFQVEFLEEVFAFLDGIDSKARKKILFNIDRAKVTNDSRLFKKLNSDIWEFRTLHNQKHYRLFAFWDKSNEESTLVIATHGLIKKSQKTPLQDLRKATDLMRKYFENKDYKK